jgi:H+/Cl- antiporter ClcA
MMSEERTTNASGQPPQAAQTGSNSETQGTFSKIWMVILFGFVAIAFTAVWLGIYGWLDKAIWSNDFVTKHTWTIPVGVVFFSLLVGLTQKYLRAPTVIRGGFTELMRGGGHEKTDSSTFPGALLSSYFSLLSGASVGPEGPLAFLIQDISAWLGEKLKVAEDSTFGLSVAALASAYNGIVGSPVFTAVFATEFQVGGKELSYAFLAWNLLAGVIGYIFFTLLKLPVFAQYIPFTPISTLTLPYVLYAILLGLVGSLLALFIGVCFQVFGKVMGRFGERVVLRTFVAGVVIAIVVYVVPQVMFAGVQQIFPMIHNPARFGVFLLLLFALLKILLLALSFKSGYLGGPIFPTLFAATMVALALSLLFPTVPLSLLALCIESAAVGLLLGAPLTAILLVAVVGTYNPYLIALMCLSTVTAMFVSAGFKRLIAQRAAGKKEHFKVNKATVQAWLEAYVHAWKTYDPGEIGELFSEDAIYASSPYSAPVHGRAAIVASWLGGPDSPSRYDGHYEPITIESDLAVTNGRSRYFAEDGSRLTSEWDNLFVLRFDSDGRCKEYREWSTERPENQNTAAPTTP